MSSRSKGKLRILELFAGIGGLRWALKVASVPGEVVAAMEINPAVLKTYAHNFPKTTILTKNLTAITSKEINDLKVDAIVMSPPCQPFCRTGNRLDTEDNRTGPLSHLTKVLQEVPLLKYIFVENVQGFEVSTARDNLLETLTKLEFKWQEFLLTPRTVQVPNSRLRYYLIGKKKDLPWPFTPDQGILLNHIPGWDNDEEGASEEKMPYARLRKQYELDTFSRRKRWKAGEDEIKDFQSQPFCIGDVIEWDLESKPEFLQQLKLSDTVLRKYYPAMDIVTPSSCSSCCFTKGYGNFIKGTGSILRLRLDGSDSTEDTNLQKDINIDFDSKLTLLRYFSPREISRLMSYPEEFTFPEGLSLRQKYRSLGNSVNVYVVAILFSLLFYDCSNDNDEL